MAKGESADLVVVGAGTVGGWASVFASEAGLKKVVVLERETVGGGASSRAAGMVRAQGGTPDTVRLGAWSIDWYRGQDARYGIDSGFQGRGYVILAVTAADERATHERISMQRATGLDARWVDADEVRGLIPAMGSTGFRGGSYVATDGWVDPPRNVRAYSLAMQQRGVQVRERAAFVGLRTRAAGRGRREVTGVRTTDGTIAASRVLLTGGPAMQAVATAAGARAWVGYARHQVVVTEASPDLHADTTAMAFDIGAGIYWRPEEGGLLWGMSNPDEEPGPGRSIDWSYLRRMERRLHRLLPVTRTLGIKKAWAATIEYTPDHFPLTGPLVLRDGTEVAGASVASACGHGMMWGPAVSRIAVDLALEGTTDVVEAAETFRMDRFDEQGTPPSVDPVALPFPVHVDDA
ncbi:MAG TPA: FAD-binding oxidoreductase [Actinomycetota bacterium]|nr:FAD-binding oxidoreductase [Actinomycetota bacterium]